MKQSRKEGSKNQKSKLYSYWQAGECEYKEEHIWSGCPKNPYSKNHKKKCIKKGEIIMFTIKEMNSFLDYEYEDLIKDDLLDDNDTASSTNDGNLNGEFNFYFDLFTCLHN